MIKEFFKSTFRTLGRVFAYVVLGILAYFILTWFGITNVKADFDTPNDIQAFWIGGTSYNVPPGQNRITCDGTCPSQSFLAQYYDSNNIIQSGHTYQVLMVVNFKLLNAPTPLNPFEITSYDMYYGSYGTGYIYPDRYFNVDLYKENNLSYFWSVEFEFDSTINNQYVGWHVYTNKDFYQLTVSFYFTDVTNLDNTDKIIYNSNINTQSINRNIQNVISDLDLHFDDLNDNLVSEEPADISILQNINNYMPSNAPLTSIITLPLTILALELNSLGGTCRAWSIPMGSLFNNYTLNIPCINPGVYLSGYSWQGHTLWDLIDLMCVMFMGYEILMLIISAWEDITSLEDTFDGLYQPRHKGYKTQHNGERI